MLKLLFGEFSKKRKKSTNQVRSYMDCMYNLHMDTYYHLLFC